MAAVVADKYHLKSIHEEIDLVDRKLAHLLKFEKFDSEVQRETAARKLTAKRVTLIKTATRLAAEGVEFKASELPRSLRSAEDIAAVEAEAAAEPKAEDTEGESPANRSDRRQGGSKYAGAVLDWQASIARYMEKKNKA
jgi:hypothetical protein